MRKLSWQTYSWLLLSGFLALGTASCSNSEATSDASVSPSPVAVKAVKKAAATPKAASKAVKSQPQSAPTASPGAKPAKSPAAKAAPAAKPGQSPAAQAPASPNPSPNQTLPPDTPDGFERAMDMAVGAVAIGQSAQSTEDWKLVASRWQEVINLLKTVPPSSNNHAKAQKKLTEYQRYLSIAQQRSIPPAKPKAASANTKATNSSINKAFFRAPIKRRLNGIPVIEVTFRGKKGQRTFDMLLDTGASRTLINEEMADALNLQPIDSMLVGIADGSVVQLPIAVVPGIEIDGRLLKNTKVAIAPGNSAGLLGHDFFDGYDITIKQSMVEFRRR